MDDQRAKTVAVFTRPFTLPGYEGTFPAGTYDIEPGRASGTRCKTPKAGTAPTAPEFVQLHPRMSLPGITGGLTVSRVDLDHARAKDKWSGKDLSKAFLEEMLADPMVHLVMEADGVSEAQLRHLYSGSRKTQPDRDVLTALPEIGTESAPLCEDIHDAQHDGTPCARRTSSSVFE